MSEVLAIPIQGSEEEIEIPVEDLPEDAGEIIDILTEESAPPQTWTSFAVAYYRRGKKENFQRILKLTASRAPASLVPAGPLEFFFFAIIRSTLAIILLARVTIWPTALSSENASMSTEMHKLLM